MSQYRLQLAIIGSYVTLGNTIGGSLMFVASFQSVLFMHRTLNAKLGIVFVVGMAQ
jgi:hypothetical protein